ncbi:MAG: ParB/RepB/Spo0J family partition protein [Vicinamibacteria bacterium]|jgi:ParB family chromosome partitioning protein|nr:ParB/RepB/Spo0J family partition protein [Vicinamibacteria bacterium]
MALGRGLSALIPQAPAAAPPAPPTRSVSQGAESLVPLSLIDANPAQPRTTIRPEALEQLARSIQESGVVQPILVRPVANGRFQIIAGERRFRAAEKLGLPTIPAVVRTVADDRVLEFALVENIQREELTPIEEAHALRRLQDELGLTQEALAGKVGKDRATVANTLRLLRLPAEVREELQRGTLSAGHARALLALEDQSLVRDLAAQAIKGGWSVRQVESKVQSARNPKAPKTRKVDANTRAAEEKLRTKLGARVEILRKRGKGEIKIAFDNEAELNRLYLWIVRG